MSSDINLSKLSRGKGEKIGQNIQVVYDDKDLTERYYAHFYHKNNDNYVHTHQLSTKVQNLPKTYLTKKGPLLLFSEDSIIEPDFFPINDRTVQLECSDLKTTRHLRNSILEFGSRHMAPFHKINEDDTIYTRFTFDRENTIDSFSFFKQHKLNYNNLNEDFQFDKIRPGFSAKRYLSNLTRHMNPRVINNLTVNGRLKEENLFEQSEIQPTIRQRIDDDLSRVPPAYRIQRDWLAVNIIPLKGYRFFRVKSDLLAMHPKEKTNLTIDEKIQVVDKDGKDIDYEALEKSDKETVLTELLLQTALQSIAEKRIEAMGNLVNGKKDLQQLDEQENIEAKLSINKFDPSEIIKDDATPTYLFQNLRGNKLTTCKNQAQLPSISLQNGPQVTVSSSPPPPPATQFTNNISDNKNLGVNPINEFKSFSVNSYLSFREESERVRSELRELEEEKAALGAIQKLTDSLVKKKMETKIEESRKKGVNVKEKLKEKKVYELLSNRSPTKLHLENTLPKLDKSDKGNQSFLKNYLANSVKPRVEKERTKGAVILGPDGEISELGHKIEKVNLKVDETKIEIEKKSVNERKGSKVPPYLYYTSKIDNEVKLEYGNLLDKPFELIDPLKRKEITQLLDIDEKKLDYSKDSVMEPVLNRHILQSLANHAQQIAKYALESQGSGCNLVADVKVALYENFNNIQTAFKLGEIDVQEFDDYTRLMKDALKGSLTKLFSESKDFRDVEIDDDLLENILEYPTKAFEISKDKFTQQKKLVLKTNYSNLNYNNWDYETEIKLQGRLQPNMKKNKPLPEIITTNSSNEGDLSLNGQVKKFSFLKRKSKPVLTEPANDTFNDLLITKSIPISSYMRSNTWTNYTRPSKKKTVKKSRKITKNEENVQVEDNETQSEKEEAEPEVVQAIKMWQVLDSTKYDETEVSNSLERPTLENTNSKDMLSSMSLKAVSNLSSEPTQTKIKVPKKPKMSERDKKMLARMNKMREKSEKDLLKKEQSSLESEASVVSEKSLPKENTLSKIKEEKSMDIDDDDDDDERLVVDHDEYDDNVSGCNSVKTIKEEKSSKKTKGGKLKGEKQLIVDQIEEMSALKKGSVKGGSKLKVKIDPNAKSEPDSSKNDKPKKGTLDNLPEEQTDEKNNSSSVDYSNDEIKVKMSKQSRKKDATLLKNKSNLKQQLSVDTNDDFELKEDGDDLSNLTHKGQTLSPTTTMFSAAIDDDSTLGDMKKSAMSNVVDAEKARELKKLKQAEQKRMETLRKRQEREEEKRKTEEENWKQEQLNKKMQEELFLKEEKRRLMHQKEMEKRKQIEEAMLEKERKRNEKIEMEKKRLADKAKRLEEARITFIAELHAKAKMEEEEKEKEELNKIAEAQRILEMNLRAQAEYLRYKAEEEEAERIKAEQYKLIHEKELQDKLNEAKRIAEDEARQRAEVEIRLKFINTCREEQAQIQLNQSITKAFVFSYYDLLSFLSMKAGGGYTKRRP